MSLQVELLSYSSDDTVTIAINNKRYEYYHINYYHYEKVRALLNKGNNSRALSLLKKFKYSKLKDNRINKAVMPEDLNSICKSIDNIDEIKNILEGE